MKNSNMAGWIFLLVVSAVLVAIFVRRTSRGRSGFAFPKPVALQPSDRKSPPGVCRTFRDSGQPCLALSGEDGVCLVLQTGEIPPVTVATCYPMSAFAPPGTESEPAESCKIIDASATQPMKCTLSAGYAGTCSDTMCAPLQLPSPQECRTAGPGAAQAAGWVQP